MRLTGSANEADDLVQDVVARAWRFRASFDAECSLPSWMFRIMRNEHLRRRRRNRLPTEPLDPWRDVGRAEPEQEWRVQGAELRRALGRLPAANREALVLVVGLGYSCEEAAARMNCAVGTAKSRVSRAREQLRRALDPPPAVGPPPPEPGNGRAQTCAVWPHPPRRLGAQCYPII